ncbi:hypothetical protein HanRHA438_Chr03g0110141 [Helianthus annuus]|nr:hypothetical protein HanRHA438_Chr03g0110141 [Helianthus annuus]
MGSAEARLGPAPVPHTAPHRVGSAQATPHSRTCRSSLLSLNTHTHVYIHTYIYIHKGAHSPPPRSIPSKPSLRDAYVRAHPLGDEALHTL